MNNIKSILKKILGKKVSSFMSRMKMKIRKPYTDIRQWILLKIFLPGYYRLYSLRKVKNDKIVFIEYRYDYISNSFALLWTQLIKNYSANIIPVFLLAGSRGYFRRTLQMCKIISDAKYVFTNEGFFTFHCLPIRKETIAVNVFHACGAFKRFGYSVLDGKFGATKKDVSQCAMYKNITYVPVSSQSKEVVLPFTEAMDLGRTPQVIRGDIGVSRTDIFFDESKMEAAYKNFYTKYPDAKDKKILLYSPTFRGNNTKKTEIPNALNIEMMFNELADDWVLVIKHHPAAKNKQDIFYKAKNFAFDVSPTMTIEDLIMISDVCISDYSSVIFEYSLFLKPMVFFAYDLIDYYDNRGFFYDYNAFTPGPICQTNRQLIERIKSIDSWFDVSTIKEFKNKYMSSCDGNATSRLMNLVFGDALEGMKRERPLEDDEIIRKAPIGTTSSKQNNTDITPKMDETLKDKFIITYLPNVKSSSFWIPNFKILTEDLTPSCIVLTNYSLKIGSFEKQLIIQTKFSNAELIELADLTLTNNKHLSRELIAQGKKVILLLSADADANLHNWCPVCYDSVELTYTIKNCVDKKV